MPAIRSIDIIIPTYRPGEKFLRLFEMLGKQTFPYTGLIVVNTEAALMPAHIRELLEKEPRTILHDIRAEAFDHAATRSGAVSYSGADAFLCMTDDAVPADTRLLEMLAASLEGEKTALAYARQIPYPDADEAEKYGRQFNYPDVSRVKRLEDLDELGIKTFFASNVCCAYRRDIFESLGGFTETAIFNEDMIYCCAAMKAGYEAAYNAEAVVLHSHSYTASQQFHRNFDLGVSQAMHPEVFGGIRSEGEGVKLLKGTIRHLAATGHPEEIPRFVTRTAFRYAGFKAGRAWEKLPDGLIRSFSMNKAYAERMIAARKKNPGK